MASTQKRFSTLEQALSQGTLWKVEDKGNYSSRSPFNKKQFSRFEERYPKLLSSIQEWIALAFMRKACSVEQILQRLRCPFCNKPVKFGGSRRHEFNTTCSSRDCRNKLAQEGWKEKYGTDWPLQNKAVKERQRKTFDERYGGFTLASPVLSKKVKATNKRKYGVEHPQELDVVKARVRETCLARHGVTSTRLIPHVVAARERALQKQVEAGKEKRRQKLLDKYGTDEHLTKKEKTAITLFKEFGVTNPSQVPEFQKKAKETCLERYGVENPLQTQENQEKARLAFLRKYGVEHPSQVPEIRAKAHETKRKNGTFNSSKPEDKAFRFLKRRFHRVKRQYRSKVYPFNCDFYIPERDLYIEYQGSWTHGGKPFDATSKADKKKALEWKQRGSDYYLNALSVWTVKDPEKRKVAKKNKVKLLEFFNWEDFRKWVKQFPKREA